MRTKKLLLPVLSLFVIAALIFVASCSEDEEPAVAPSVSVSPDAYTGAPGETVNATVTGDLDGAFVSMTITKYNGTSIDTDWETNGSMEVTSGLPYNFSYILGPEGLDGTAGRFGFVVTDDNQLTGQTNLIITTEATRTQLLTFFDWQYHSLLWQDTPDTWAEGIADCEKDNILTFNADGTMDYDYGALVGPDNCGEGGCEGSCSGDGVLNWVGWSFNDDESVLSAYRVDAETETPWDTVVWEITEFDHTYWRGTVDLGAWGLFDYGHAAVAKD
jgi:hypothetical protein